MVTNIFFKVTRNSYNGVVWFTLSSTKTALYISSIPFLTEFLVPTSYKTLKSDNIVWRKILRIKLFSDGQSITKIASNI